MPSLIHPLKIYLNKAETAGAFFVIFQLAFGEEGRQNLGGAGGTWKTVAQVRT